MFSYEEKKSWKRKDYWRDDFKRVSCAYCFYDCEMEHCIDNDFYCDNFIPRDID